MLTANERIYVSGRADDFGTYAEAAKAAQGAPVVYELRNRSGVLERRLTWVDDSIVPNWYVDGNAPHPHGEHWHGNPHA